MKLPGQIGGDRPSLATPKPDLNNTDATRQRLINRIERAGQSYILIYNDTTWVVARPDFWWGSALFLWSWHYGAGPDGWWWDGRSYRPRVYGGDYAAISARDVDRRLPSSSTVAPVPAAPLSAREAAFGALRTQLTSEAVEALREFVATNPKDTEAKRALAFALLGTGRLIDARSMILAAYTADPSLAIRPLAPSVLPAKATTDWLQRAVAEANRVNSGSSWLLAAVLTQTAGRPADAARMITKAKAAGLSPVLVDRMTEALQVERAAPPSGRR